MAVLAAGEDVDEVVRENDLIQLGYLPDSRTLLFTAPGGFDPGVFTAYGPNEVIEYTEAGNGYISFYEGDGSSSDYSGQEALAGLNLSTVHLTAKGRRCEIAVLDTGVDLDHPQIAANITVDDKTVLGVPDLDGIKGPGDDAYAHGTHVCGVILNMAPMARLFPYKVLGEDGRGTLFALAAGIDAAIAQGVDIVNMSLSVNAASPVIIKAISRLDVAGIIVVAAGGNNTPGALPVYPATAPTTYGVASTGGPNSDYSTISDFSAMHRTDLAFAAPGYKVAGAYPLELEPTIPIPISEASGTSTACAVVSGAMALMLGEQDPIAPLGQQIDRLEQNTEPVVPAMSVKFGLVSPANAIAAPY